MMMDPRGSSFYRAELSCWWLRSFFAGWKPHGPTPRWLSISRASELQPPERRLFWKKGCGFFSVESTAWIFVGSVSCDAPDLKFGFVPSLPERIACLKPSHPANPITAQAIIATETSNRRSIATPSLFLMDRRQVPRLTEIPTGPSETWNARSGRSRKKCGADDAR
jgi:hypothetical protein